MSYSHLPRDVQLCIVSWLDIDARIRCGIVFKLRVPDCVAARISAALKMPFSIVKQVMTIKLGNQSNNRCMVLIHRGSFRSEEVIAIDSSWHWERHVLNPEQNEWSKERQ